MRARGISGELRVGYQTAAVLGSWELEPDSDRLSLKAEIVSENDFWISQRPIDVKLVAGPIAWLWKDVHPRRQGNSVTIRLAGRPNEAL